MLDGSPRGKVAATTLGNENMDMGIPFEVSAESVQDAYETRSKRLFFVH